MGRATILGSALGLKIDRRSRGDGARRIRKRPTHNTLVPLGSKAKTKIKTTDSYEV